MRAIDRIGLMFAQAVVRMAELEDELEAVKKENAELKAAGEKPEAPV